MPSFGGYLVGYFVGRGLPLGSGGRLTSGVDVVLEVGLGLVAGALGAEVVETGRDMTAAVSTAAGTTLD